MNELKEITVEEISFVDAGANPKAKLLLYKRKETDKMADKNTKDAKETTVEKKDTQPTVDAEKEQLQKRVAELEKALADRDAADKAAIEKAAKDKLDETQAAVNAAIERINKRMEEHIDKVETAELMKVASKYEILGEKADELCKVLKDIKGTEVYDKLIGNLDRELAYVEKAGTFTELGRKGFNSQAISIEKYAQAIQEKEPTLSPRWALDKAYQQNPNLK